MRYFNWFAGLTLGLGMAMSGMAAERGWDRRDIGADYKQIERLRADVARDRARLNEDIRRGRQHAAAQDARDLAHDQRALDALTRDARYDRRDVHNDYGRDTDRGYSYGYRDRQ